MTHGRSLTVELLGQAAFGVRLGLALRRWRGASVGGQVTKQLAGTVGVAVGYVLGGRRRVAPAR